MSEFSILRSIENFDTCNSLKRVLILKLQKKFSFLTSPFFVLQCIKGGLIMNGNRQVVSISLPEKSLLVLEKICRQQDKTRSEVIREFIRRYSQQQQWQEIFSWGEKTAGKFDIRSEKDILRLIND